MCGIVGLFLKDKTLEPKLGAMLSDMLVIMTDRGPDSAGIAIYGAPSDGRAKITVQSAKPAIPCEKNAARTYGAVPHKSRQRPSRRSRIASSARASRCPAATSCSNC